jgi:glycosyltransferase involved in cell wall biosynthesis
MTSVSIIMPARIDSPDKAKWIDLAVQSVLWQTRYDWELLIVDDHSPLSVKDIWNNQRIMVMPASGAGVAQARNQAAAIAKSDALFCLDADDMIDERALELIYAEWRQMPNWLVYPGALDFDGNAARIVPIQDYSYDALAQQSLFHIGAMFPRTAWLKSGGWKDGLDGVEDWEFWLTLGEMGVCGVALDIPLYWYRKHPNGLSHQTEPTSIAKLKELHREGKKMAGCCGSGRKARTQQTQSSSPQQPETEAKLPLEEGSDILEYTGNNFAVQEWRGGATGTRYAFGGSRRRGYVDPRDTQSLVAKGVFQIVEPAA